jgi:hypothetical protein
MMLAIDAFWRSGPQPSVLVLPVVVEKYSALNK